MILHSMKIYAVYIHPDKQDPYEAAEFVQEGFNFFAFIFAPVWSLYHRLWWLFILILVINTLTYVAGQHWGVSEDILMPIKLGWAAIIAMNGNDWIAEDLHRRGWVLVDIVTGGTLVAAQQRFYDRHVDKLIDSEAPPQLGLQFT